MAPYEPKTDSREFEVATQGQDPGAWGGESASDATDVAIRLWGPEWSGQPGSQTWRTDSVFVYMIADLVLASHGRLAEESTTVMTAHFDNSRQALVAAKRIQMSILDFVACRPGNGVAIVIHQPSVQSATSGLVQAALQLAKPGQILVGGDVSRRLRESFGVDLVPVSALAAGTAGQRGLAELVWTTAERLASLQSSVVDGAASRRESPPVGATMMVSTPILDAPVVRAPIRGTEPETTTPVVKPVAGIGDFVFKRSSDSALRRTPAAPDLAPRSEDVRDMRDDSLTQELDDLEQRPFLTRTRVILGLAAIVLVGALIAVLYFPTRETKIPPRVLENHETGSGSVDSKSDTFHPEQPQPPPTQPKPPLAKAPEPQAKLPKVVVQPPAPAAIKPAADSRPNKKKDNPEQPQPPPVQEFGGLSQNDVPTLLRLARDDAGAGKYDKARSEYKKVLQLQPGNQDAKDGLRRLDLIKSDNE